MKNAIKLFLVTAFLFIPAALFGQGSESTGAAPQPRQPSSAGTNDDSNLTVTRSVSGKIVGLKEGILIIKTQKDKEVRVALASKTKYKIGKKNIDTSELDEKLFAEGRSIKITYLPVEDKQKRFDKLAVEVRFDEDKDKQKPVLG